MKKYLSKHPQFFITLLYFIFRLTNLTILPIFNDEATYIDWGWRMINIPKNGYYSVLFAKPPLFMWVFGLSQKLLSNPLFAGRIISVLAGYITMLGLWKVSSEFSNKKTAVLASVFYISLPLFQFFDRQALMESAITAAGVWSFYFCIKSIKENHIKYPILLGVIIGVGYFVKSNSFNFYLATTVLFGLTITKKHGLSLEKAISKLAVVSVSSLVILFPLLKQESFWTTLSQNQKYILTVSEILKFPVSNWVFNLDVFVNVLIIYLNPVTCYLFLAIYYKYRKVDSKNKITILLLIWIIITIGTSLLIGRRIEIRHTVSFLPLILIPAASSLSKIFDVKKKLFLLLSLFILPTLALTLLQTFSPVSYFNALDKVTKFSGKSAYVTGWPSGYGVTETVDYLKSKGQSTIIIAGVRVDAGNPENSVFAYFNGSKSVIPTYLDSMLFQDFNSYDCLGSRVPIYFISRDNNFAGLKDFLIEEKKFWKPGQEHFIGVYKLKTSEKCNGKALKLI